MHLLNDLLHTIKLNKDLTELSTDRSLQMMIDHNVIFDMYLRKCSKN